MFSAWHICGVVVFNRRKCGLYAGKEALEFVIPPREPRLIIIRLKMGIGVVCALGYQLDASPTGFFLISPLHSLPTHTGALHLAFTLLVCSIIVLRHQHSNSDVPTRDSRFQFP